MAVQGDVHPLFIFGCQGGVYPLFKRAVTAELTAAAAAAVVWWGDSGEKVVTTQDVVWHRDWMREW